MNTTTKPVVVGIAGKQPSALGVAIRQASATASPLWVVHTVGIPSQAGDFYAGPELLDDLRVQVRACSTTPSTTSSTRPQG